MPGPLVHGWPVWILLSVPPSHPSSERWDYGIHATVSSFMWILNSGPHTLGQVLYPLNYLPSFILAFLNKRLIYFCTISVCLHVYVRCVCLVSMEGKTGSQSPCNWSYRQSLHVWCWEPKLVLCS